MKLAYEMKYTHPTDEVTSVRMIPYSSTFQEAYREMYNECGWGLSSGGGW